MSRQIDFTKPLSDSDRQWLTDNNRFRDIETADAMAAADDPEALLAGTGTPTGDPGTGIGTQAAAVGARQAEGLQVAPGADGPVNVALGAAQATQEPEGVTGEDGQDNYDDEAAWSYRELADEVKGRRDVAGDSYDGPALNSPREDLIAWLRTDDERDDASDEG